MFLKDLTQLQQGVFLSLADKVAKSDGRFCLLEVDLISRLQTEIKPGISPVCASKAIEAFTCGRSKRICLMELIGIGFADGVYDEQERATIASIAQDLSIDKHELGELESWVSRQMALISEAKSILEV